VRNFASCTLFFNQPEEYGEARECNSATVVAVFSGVQMVMMVVWLGLIVVHVKKHSKAERVSMRVAYFVPVERLFSGKTKREDHQLKKVETGETAV